MSDTKNKKQIPKHIKRAEVWLLTELHEQLKSLSVKLDLSMSELLATQVRNILVNHRDLTANVSGKFHVNQEQYTAYLDGALSPADLIEVERCALTQEVLTQQEQVAVEAPTPSPYPFPKSRPEEASTTPVSVEPAIEQNDVEVVAPVETLQAVPVAVAPVDIDQAVKIERQPIEAPASIEQEPVDNAVDNAPVAPHIDMVAALDRDLAVEESPVVTHEPAAAAGSTSYVAEPVHAEPGEEHHEQAAKSGFWKTWFSHKTNKETQ